jgi:hypothetical protein
MKAIKHSMSRFLATGFSIKADIKRDKKNDRSGSKGDQPPADAYPSDLSFTGRIPQGGIAACTALSSLLLSAGIL